MLVRVGINLICFINIIIIFGKLISEYIGRGKGWFVFYLCLVIIFMGIVAILVRYFSFELEKCIFCD